MRKVINIVKKMWQGAAKPTSTNNKPQPTIIARPDHIVSRSDINKAALKVLYRLHQSGFAAYLVGGSVRDLLIGLHPKDFDIATDAHPEQIQRLFSNSFIIGRRFKLVHVRFGQEIIEVATFRGETANSVGRVRTHQGMLLRDNVYGTLDDDVWRRDFTVNALYYNIADFSVIDYAEGMRDLKQKLIRVIGKPLERYREDPARMLRAIRLAAKLDFTIESNSIEGIKKLKELLLEVPSARLFDKIMKIFHSGKSLATFHLLQELDVFKVLFPQVDEVVKGTNAVNFLEAAFKSTDQRISEDKSINSAFLFAVLLWPPMQSRKKEIKMTNPHEVQSLHTALVEVIGKQLKIISIPRRLTTVIREIWHLQYHLEHARSKRIYKTFYHERFRAAYDFLMLRASSIEPDLLPIAKWWTDFQEADEELREKLIAERSHSIKRPKRRKRKKKSDTSLHSTGE